MMMINNAVTPCLLPAAVRSQLLPAGAPVAAAPSPQARWVSPVAVTWQTTGLNSPVLHLPGFITLTCTHTFYIVKHYKCARVSKAGSDCPNNCLAKISSHHSRK